MRVTPEDIFKKEFKKSMRGYDVDEVNEFLDQIIQSYEEVLEENKELKQQLNSPNQHSKRLKRVHPEENQDQILQEIMRRLEHLEQRMQIKSYPDR
ncbi:DivIVA domain-containing protein [Melghirimyces algeriensis]|uniref:DivIVA domain-containing protein n=1 Tax=Melghirimyces algeriensis TaxID=910412 RepID=A0A521BRH3_9BACL|nr:DivIVA domain-containing protein [Melghirimyces algeriensis]SMO49756.1 DivIVA domain-containing protein [Melghirimyces algeriensis]